MKHFIAVTICLLGLFAASNLMAVDLYRPTYDVKDLKRPKNLSRLNIGARMEMNYQNGSEDALQPDLVAGLLSEDFTLGCPLPAGKTGFVMSLSSIQTVSQFSFIVEKAGGIVTVSVANTFWPVESPKWNVIRKVQKFSSVDEQVSVELGLCDAKYIRVEFDLSDPGRVSSFGIYGKPDQMDYKLQRASEIKDPMMMKIGEKTSRDYLNYDFANSTAGGEVVYVSSNNDAKSPAYINDDLLSTSFEFDDNDKSPTMIVSLKDSKIINRVALCVEAGEGELQVFLLDSLPVDYQGSAGLRKQIQGARLNGFIFAALGTQIVLPSVPLVNGLAPQFKLPNSFFEKHEPIQVYKLKGGREMISMNFQPRPAAHLLLHCVPKDGIASRPFVVNKLSAFGSVEVEKEKYVVVYEPVSALAEQRLVDKVGNKEKDGEKDNPDDKNPKIPELVPLPEPPIISN